MLKVEKGKIYAVITGDIVGSSQLDYGTRRQLFDTMRVAGKNMRQWLGKSIMPLPLDIFSGDSWQVLLTDPSRALDAAVFYRVNLIAGMRGAAKVDTRSAIALGPVDFVPGTRVSEGEGLAFRESGRALADKKTVHRMCLRGPGEMGLKGWEIAVILLDALLRRRLTPANAAVVGYTLRGLNQQIVAELLNPPVRQPVVARHLKSAEWQTVAECLAEYRTTMEAKYLLKR